MNIEFGIQLKSLRLIKGVTQKEIAARLGVGQTTVANYEKGLRIPDTDKLLSIAEFFDVSIDYLLCRKEVIANQSSKLIIPITEHSLEENSSLFLHYLLNEDKNMARTLIMSLYERGLSLEDMYFKIFTYALKKVGEYWEIGQMEVWQEHYISEVILDLMSELKAKENGVLKNNYSILTLTPGSELHNIGLKMISDLLELRGWDVTYIGSNVPVKSLLQAIEIIRPNLLAISVTMPDHIDSACNTISAIKNRFGKKAPTIVVGGNAFINCKDICKETGANYSNITLLDFERIAAK